MIRKIFPLLIVLIFTSCGYTPIYNKLDKTDYKINILEINGDRLVNNFKLKVIDFGMAEVNNKRRLVTFNIGEQKFDYSGLEALHKQARSRIPNDGEGYLTEKYFYPLKQNKGFRPRYIRTFRNKYDMGPALETRLQQTVDASKAKISKALLLHFKKKSQQSKQSTSIRSRIPSLPFFRKPRVKPVNSNYINPKLNSSKSKAVKQVNVNSNSINTKNNSSKSKAGTKGKSTSKRSPFFRKRRVQPENRYPISLNMV